MKCTFVVVLLSIGLLIINAEDEVTEVPSENTEPSIAIEKVMNVLSSMLTDVTCLSFICQCTR